MSNRQCLELQTELIELFLPELDQLVTDGLVNFNNTKQLDTLLRHLELTTSALIFNAVPSTTILHILFTLSIRAPSLNWSHDTNSFELVVTSEYMRQVNKTYDSALYRELIQKRASFILHQYIILMVEEDSSSTSLLYDRMQEVILTFMSTANSIKNSFDDTKKEDLPEVGTPAIPVAIEIVSDSEESDAIVDADESVVLPEYQDISKPNFARSFTDLGNRTSGLGQTAVLFKDMPHLLTQVTPEPPSDTDEQKAKRQKRLPTIDNILIFDDILLCKRLQDDPNYNIWNVIRWTFWCAEASAQYQEYLFNSSQTKLHEIYDAYKSTLDVIVQFCRLFLVDKKRFRVALRSRLFGALGTRSSMFDRGIEYIFTGLGIPTNDFPTPYYPRERILLLSDPAVQVSQCKDVIEYDDNKASMKLRLQLLELLCLMLNGDTKRLSQFSNLLVEKLASLPDVYLWAFFDSFEAENHTSDSFCDEFCDTIVFVAYNLIRKFSGRKLRVFSDDDHRSILKEIMKSKIYLSMIQDAASGSFAPFYEKWETVLKLVKRIMFVAFSDTQSSREVSIEEFQQEIRKAFQQIVDTLSPSLTLVSDESDIIEEEFFTPSPTAHSQIEVDDSVEETILLTNSDKEKIIEKFRELLIVPLTFYA